MSTLYYRDLLAQRARIDAFREAIRRVVRPGDRVLDLGTGLGTYAFFAAEAGAQEVYAVDGDPIVHVAHAVAQANGLDGRVRCLRGVVPEVSLPAPPDVLIFEDFPPRLLDARVFLLYRDLHDGVLARGVRTVPARARLFLAPVRSDRVDRLTAPFGPEDRTYGIDWRQSRDYVTNAPRHMQLASSELAAPPAAVAELSFDGPVAADALSGEGRWTLDEAGPVHALVMWFDLELASGIELSNAPGTDPCSWGNLVLPLHPPLDVGNGGELRATIAAPPDGAGTPGWLAWSARTGDTIRRGNEFASLPAGLHDLLAGSPDGRPALTTRGAVEARALALADGRRTARDIARDLRASYPSLSEAAALHAVADALRGRVRPAALNGGRRHE